MKIYDHKVFCKFCRHELDFDSEIQICPTCQRILAEREEWEETKTSDYDEVELLAKEVLVLQELEVSIGETILEVVKIKWILLDLLTTTRE